MLTPRQRLAYFAPLLSAIRDRRPDQYCQRHSGVSVMENQVAEFALPKDRPLRQRLALLLMRRSDNAAAVMAEIYRIDGCLDPLRASDFSPLADSGWASKSGDRHRLTEAGVSAADHVVHAFAFQLGLHLKIVRAGARGRFHHSMACTCGRAFSHSRNNGHWWSAQQRMWSHHLAEVEDAKAKGITYVAPEVMLAARLVMMQSPPLQAEASHG